MNTPHDWPELYSFLLNLRLEDVAPGGTPKPIHRFVDTQSHLLLMFVRARAMIKIRFGQGQGQGLGLGLT